MKKYNYNSMIRFKGLLIALVLMSISFSMNGQAEKEMKQVLQTLTLEQKIKILEYAKNLEKEVDEAIMKQLKKLSDDNQGKLLEYAQSVGSENPRKVKRPKPADAVIDLPMTTVDFAEMEYNFGQVKEGEIVEYVYKFKNTGDKPYVIHNAKGSCGCTVPEWTREAIQPGESGTVKVRFDTKHKVGNRIQKVYISSNTEPSIITLKLVGKVEEGH